MPKRMVWGGGAGGLTPGSLVDCREGLEISDECGYIYGHMVIGVRELRNKLTQILRAVETRGEGVVVSRHGRPTALILPIDSEEAEDYVMAHAPEILRSMREANRDLEHGRTVPLEEYRDTRGV